MASTLPARSAAAPCHIAGMHPFLAGLVGGACIGLAAFLLLATTGRTAGVSGIADGLLPPARGDAAWRAAFIGGLVLGGILLHGHFQIGPEAAGSLPSPAILATAGFLVGFGARVGGGCTSGHGVCGIACMRPQSIVATSIFLATGIATVAIVRHLVRP